MRRKHNCLILVLGVVGFLLLLLIYEQINSMSYYEFDWLRNINYLHLFVRPKETTAVIVPKNYTSSLSRQFIACFVLSRPGNHLARNAIRETWGKRIRPLFVIAQRYDESLIPVLHEAELFDDIIVEDFVDRYENLTIKTAFALKHFVQHFPSTKYFLKIDDDVFINADNLYKLIKEAPSNSLIGKVNTHSIPYRNKKDRWYVPEFLFGDEMFPDYLEGPGYLIPGHLVPAIYETSMQVPYFTLEDVFFTGHVAGKLLNFPFHGSKKFKTERILTKVPCLYEDYIIVHDTAPKDLMKMWQRTEGGNCSFLYKIFNWLVCRHKKNDLE